MTEFKFVKYAADVRCQVGARLDPLVERLCPAPELGAVLACGRTVHKYSTRRGVVDRAIKGLRTTVLRCVHVPGLRSFFISTVESRVGQYDDSWFKLMREWITEDPQMCFYAPKPTEYRKGYTSPTPTTLISGDRLVRSRCARVGARLYVCSGRLELMGGALAAQLQPRAAE